MGNWKTWLCVIVAFLLIRQCGGCSGSDEIDLTETNTLVLKPYDGCPFSELKLTLYADHSLHAEGVWADSGESFSQDYGIRWEYKERSFHDKVYKGVSFSIQHGYDRDSYRSYHRSFGISDNLELLMPEPTDPDARAVGKFKKK